MRRLRFGGLWVEGSGFAVLLGCKVFALGALVVWSLMDCRGAYGFGLQSESLAWQLSLV